MYEVAVLQIQDPSCFWCEILKSNGQDVKEKVEYEQMYDELNCLYAKYYRNVEEIKPACLSVGEFCMIFCEELKSWCRAILNAPACSAEDNLVECFLVDHAIYWPVKKKNIRLPVEACHRLPFRAKKFKLHQIQPVSLCVDICGDKAEFGIAEKWDTAAVEYFKHLLTESVHAEAKVFSVENNVLSVYLYITTTEVTVCVNDELVAKSFACFCSDVKSCEKIMPTSLQDVQPYKEVDNPAQMLWPEIYKTKKMPIFHAGPPINEKTTEMESRNHCEKKSEEKQAWNEKHDFDK
ncbi:tudor domain containing 12 L homeolog [Xenopus laevis]|nr:tudor domain containing 12 L homeolog [Xenopus laevis]AAH73709.1 MGC83648 protein [Xenopus laevis]